MIMTELSNMKTYLKKTNWITLTNYHHSLFCLTLGNYFWKKMIKMRAAPLSSCRSLKYWHGCCLVKFFEGIGSKNNKIIHE